MEDENVKARSYLTEREYKMNLFAIACVGFFFGFMAGLMVV